MTLSKLELSRRWIGAGFALLTIASIANLFNFGLSIFHVGLRLGVQIFLSPVAALLTLVGWLFLTRYRPRDSSQTSSQRAGLLALALQFAALSLGSILRANSVVFGNWASAQFWIALLGYVVATVGFLMAFIFIPGAGESTRASRSITTPAPPAGLLIFVGFVLIALSSLVILYYDVTGRYFAFVGWRNILQTIIQPLSSLFAAGGWWFLSRLGAHDEEQRSIIRRAYWALGLASAVIAVLELLTITEVSGLSQFTWELWLSAVGSAVATMGYILTARRPATPAKANVLASTP
jgi:hypothetical protein